jgi:ribosomal peptide maturation radical SAM protein 1
MFNIELTKRIIQVYLNLNMKRLRSLLISLPWADCYYPSLKIGSVSAYAKSKGFDVKALHLHLEVAFYLGIKDYLNFLDIQGEALSAAILFPQKRKTILKKLNNYPISKLKQYEAALRRIYTHILHQRFDLVGFSVDFFQLFSSLLIASWIKRDFPHVRILFGGLTISGYLGESLLECFPQVDWCISGEGEIPFVMLLENLSKGSKNFESSIPGLIYRSARGTVSNSRIQLKNLKCLPDPDYEHYFDFLQDYAARKGEVFPAHIPIEASRGCIYKCAFCAARLHAQGYRARPPNEVAEQMLRLSDKYGILDFEFFDLMMQPKNNLLLFSDILKQQRDYNIIINIRSDTSKPLISTMKRVGVNLVQIDIEALSSSLLRKMNKGVKFIQNLQVLKFCEELNIKHASNLILKFPGETQKDVDEAVRNIDFASAYRPPLKMTPFALLKGSLADTMRQKHGIHSVKSYVFIDDLLPSEMRGKLLCHIQSFKTKRPFPKYAGLRLKVNEWRNMYDRLCKEGIKPLIYRDGGKYLIIEDSRNGRTMLRLDDDVRELYLFCDGIRSFTEIVNRFPKYKHSELRTILRSLVEFKIMYQEEREYLSLAVHVHNTEAAIDTYS